MQWNEYGWLWWKSIDDQDISWNIWNIIKAQHSSELYSDGYDTVALALTVWHMAEWRSLCVGPFITWQSVGIWLEAIKHIDTVKVDDDAGLLMLIMMLMEMMLLLMMIMVILGRPSWSRRLKLGLEAIKQVPLGCRPLSLSSLHYICHNT